MNRLPAFLHIATLWVMLLSYGQWNCWFPSASTLALYPGIRQLNGSPSNATSRFALPAGYRRQVYDQTSFQYYLSHFPLQPKNARVYYYNGTLKPNQGVSAAVLDIDIGKKDLQQCADAVIRLRAEYLFKFKRFNEIRFSLTNGFRADYIKWKEGYRLKVSGNSTSWYKATAADDSYESFRNYLDLVFMYAGTLSLSKELNTIMPEDLEPGDVFIKGGRPGHAIIITDVAINTSTNKKIFMVAQSYMPAQSIHLLVNNQNKALSPWYDLSEMDKMYSPEWTFEKKDLKRF